MFDKQIGPGSTLLLVILVILNLFVLTTLYGCAEPPDNQDDGPNVTPEPTTLVLLAIFLACGSFWCLTRRRKR